MLKINKINNFSLFILCSIFIFFGSTAKAENINLGNFSGNSDDGKMFKNLTLKVSGSSYSFSDGDIEKLIQRKEGLSYNSQYDSEIENTDFCDLKKSVVCKLTFRVEDEKHIQKTSQLYLDASALSKFLDDLSEKTDKEPENARIQAENGKISVFSLSHDGIRLDKEKSLRILIDSLRNNGGTRTLDLPYDVIKPDISTDSIDNLGITSLIGEGNSNFAGSPKNRIFNIKVATEKFNGLLIKPGEEFSFVKNLGPVDGEHGYLPELVIKKDKTEPEFGGGICQVSTTAFRAAVYSGLKITARKNHAYPVSYYNPQGMDSTVYIPWPDLRFINNTPNHILIQTKIVGTTLNFSFYGTDDGRKTTVIGPTITERNPDGSMKATFTQQVADKNEKILIDDVFNSSYDSPSKYPHPGQTLTKKPADWSDKEWKKYKKDNNL